VEESVYSPQEFDTSIPSRLYMDNSKVHFKTLLDVSLSNPA